MNVARSCAALVLLGLALTTSPATAHEARPLYVEIDEIGSGRFEMRWRVPPVVASGNRPEVSVRACEAAAPVRWFDEQRLVGQLQLHCPGGVTGSRVDVAYPHHNPAVSTLVRLSWASGESHTVLAGPEETSIALPTQETASGVARDYTLLGFEHILFGYDHLLFVACLLLLAGTVRRVLVTITGFTVAHSITLGLAALDLVSLPIPAVEAVIALSIVFLAVEVARGRRDTLAWKYPVTVSVSFGLLHGFGFASVLSQIGLPQTEVPTALLFFNVGVEIGQVLFVAALVISFASLRRMGAFARSEDGHNVIPERLNLPAAYVIGSLASLWMFSRIAEF